MNIRVLDPPSAALWFAALTDALPAADDIVRLVDLLAPGSLRPHLRIVAARDGTPFGRLAALCDGECITIWNPSFRDHTGQEDIREAMQMMTRRATAARRGAGFAHLPIENRPGDDLAHNDLWLRVIKEEGYLETCIYQVYASAIDGVPLPARPLPGMIFRDVGSQNSGLVKIYSRVRSQTLQQRHADRDNPRGAIDRMRMVGRGIVGAAWVIACLNGTPAGYALANLADEGDFEGTSAWLVDIGCLPEYRRRGIGAALLGEIIRRLKAASVRTLLAAIDDVNLPSLQLHAAFGFQPLPGRHYIYRLPPEQR